MKNPRRVIRRPVLTEQSLRHKENLNQFTFEVDRKANKIEIKYAVETLFDVDVVRVNIVNTPAKRGRRARSRRLLVRRPGYKKAIVTLAEGQTLEMFEGVQ